MTDEPKKQPDDIQGILSDLDEILSGLGDPGDAPAPLEAAAAPPEMPAAPPEAPAVSPELSEDTSMHIELAPRAGSLPPPAKKPEPPKTEPAKPLASQAKPPLEIPLPAAIPEPPKPVAAPKPPEPAAPPSTSEPPKAAEPPKPAAPAPEDIPATASKDQIRRVAYVYTFACVESRASFAAFLSQAARTISKKPLYLRQVMASEVTAGSDPLAVFEKARDAKAAAVLAVVDGWPPAKIDALGEACARGGLLFRAVSPADVQKKSTAVDVIVDMMLLSGEA